MDDETVLGCKKGASLDELRTAYTKLARSLHPDKNGGRPSEEFLSVQRAWERLKSRYDAQARAAPPQEVDLDDMIFDEANQLFSYRCRCGETIVVTCNALEQGHNQTSCPNCSLRISVAYEIDYQ